MTWRLQPALIERFRSTQLELLHAAAAQTRPGGVLVYSTCSLEPEENSDLAKKFLAAHADFKLASERELLPWADQVDGAYVAKFVSR